jgi:hypothetical protein
LNENIINATVQLYRSIFNRRWYYNC